MSRRRNKRHHYAYRVCVKVASDLLWAVQVLGPHRLATKRLTLHRATRDDKIKNVKWDLRFRAHPATPREIDARNCVMLDIHQGNRFYLIAWIMTLLIWACRRVGGDGCFDLKPLFAALLESFFQGYRDTCKKWCKFARILLSLHSFRESCLFD